MQIAKMYIVKSTRTQVDKPIEREIIDIKERFSKRFYSDKTVELNKYMLDKIGYPYEIIMESDKQSMTENLYSTGIGDCWQSAYYSTLSEEDANEYHEKEKIRIQEKYLSLPNN